MHMTYDVAMETLPLLRFTTKNSPTFLLFTWTFLFVKCRPFAMQKPQSSLLDYSVRCNKFSYSQVIYVCSLSTGSTTSFEYEYSAVNRFFFYFPRESLISAVVPRYATWYARIHEQTGTSLHIFWNSVERTMTVLSNSRPMKTRTFWLLCPWITAMLEGLLS